MTRANLARRKAAELAELVERDPQFDRVRAPRVVERVRLIDELGRTVGRDFSVWFVELFAAGRDNT